MKPVLKYIALLIVAGLIILLYMRTVAVNMPPVISTAKADLVDNTIKHDGTYHFAIVRDAAAKLLPALNFFK